ncbi:hypothetical protein DPMN_066743 [Dreissena polymorpha]|uniref:Uncharacterized protein n=1 Tax=Dreissena polymorpha TaxID=45954 RepID=A0A9D4BKT5_DREPO|nr:hypothetical protein DPMN_066743 [Dreissena polymorpha]
MEEISATLKNMKNDNSPGSDGFTTEFLKNDGLDLHIPMDKKTNNGRSPTQFQEDIELSSADISLPGGRIIQGKLSRLLTLTIFELSRAIIRTNVLTKFHEDWSINVNYQVLRRKLPPGGHVFQRTRAIFKHRDIIKTYI